MQNKTILLTPLAYNSLKASGDLTHDISYDSGIVLGMTVQVLSKRFMPEGVELMIASKSVAEALLLKRRSLLHA